MSELSWYEVRVQAGCGVPPRQFRYTRATSMSEAKEKAERRGWYVDSVKLVETEMAPEILDAFA